MPLPASGDPSSSIILSARALAFTSAVIADGRYLRMLQVDTASAARKLGLELSEHDTERIRTVPLDSLVGAAVTHQFAPYNAPPEDLQSAPGEHDPVAMAVAPQFVLGVVVVGIAGLIVGVVIYAIVAGKRPGRVNDNSPDRDKKL